MFDSTILALDPGVASVGLAVIGSRAGDIAVRWTATLRTPADMPQPMRLERVHRAVSKAIEVHQPSALAIERLMWNRNVTSGMVVARASGVILLAAAQAGVPVFEYGAREVKMAASGDGAASKQQVRASLRAVHGLAGIPSQPDAADAVAVGLCHLIGASVRAEAALAAATQEASA